MGEICDWDVLSILSAWFGGVPSQGTRGRYEKYMTINIRVWFLTFRLVVPPIHGVTSVFPTRLAIVCNHFGQLF